MVTWTSYFYNIKLTFSTNEQNDIPRKLFHYFELFFLSPSFSHTNLDFFKGPPSPVRTCLTSNYTSSGFLVKCDPGDSGGLKQTFTVNVYDTGHNLVFNSSSIDSPIFWINNLHSSTPYKVNVYSTNFKGRSKSVNLTGSTLQSPQKQTGKGKFVH